MVRLRVRPNPDPNPSPSPSLNPNPNQDGIEAGLLVQAGFAAAAAAVLGSLCFYYCCLRVRPAHAEAAARGHKRLGAGKLRADCTLRPPRAGATSRQSPSASRHAPDCGLCAASPAVDTPSLEQAVTEMTAAVARL